MDHIVSAHPTWHSLVSKKGRTGQTLQVFLFLCTPELVNIRYHRHGATAFCLYGIVASTASFRGVMFVCTVAGRQTTIQNICSVTRLCLQGGMQLHHAIAIYSLYGANNKQATTGTNLGASFLYTYICATVFQCFQAVLLSSSIKLHIRISPLKGGWHCSHNKPCCSHCKDAGLWLRQCTAHDS